MAQRRLCEGRLITYLAQQKLSLHPLWMSWLLSCVLTQGNSPAFCSSSLISLPPLMSLFFPSALVLSWPRVQVFPLYVDLPFQIALSLF